MQILLCVVIGVTAITPLSRSFAGENPDPGAQIGSETDPSPEPLAGSGKEPRYHRLMRNLDEEYQQGGLTKTEYIQRKRLIEAEER